MRACHVFMIRTNFMLMIWHDYCEFEWSWSKETSKSPIRVLTKYSDRAVLIRYRSAVINIE